MGRIVFEEYRGSGTQNNSYVQVFNIEKLVLRTEDSTTSTTAESITVSGETNLLRIYSSEAHRIASVSAQTGNGGAYITTPADGYIELAVAPGDEIFYRTDV